MPILTIDSARLNGTPSTGTVRITASRSPLMDSGSNTVFSGTQTFPLDAQGKLSVSLPATDSPSLGAPFTYTVEANLASGQWIYRGVKLPANVATIDITDAQSASQKVYPTRQEWDAITGGKVTGAGMTLRHDTRVGTRVLLDHPGGLTMLHGTTGRRDIRDLYTGAVDIQSAFLLHLSRTNNIVRLRGRIRRSDIASISQIVLFAAPYGFRLDGFITKPAGENRFIGAPNDNTSVTLSATSGMTFGDLPVNNVIFDVLWETLDDWPSSLPGLPD